MAPNWIVGGWSLVAVGFGCNIGSYAIQVVTVVVEDVAVAKEEAGRSKSIMVKDDIVRDEVTFVAKVTHLVPIYTGTEVAEVSVNTAEKLSIGATTNGMVTYLAALADDPDQDY